MDNSRALMFDFASPQSCEGPIMPFCRESSGCYPIISAFFELSATLEIILIFGKRALPVTLSLFHGCISQKKKEAK